MSEKRYRNIVPITCYNVVVEPGQVWERVSDGYRHGRAICEVGTRIVQDTRLFEPVEEWPKYGDGYRCISSVGANLGSIWCDSTWDRAGLAVGNCFHPDTRLNKHGVHIDNVRKLFLLGLKSEGFADVCVNALLHRQPTQFHTAGWDIERAILAEIEDEPSES